MDDVASLAATTFAQMPLRSELKRALQAMGFHSPSPIQLRALPIALCGSDVIGQAKSGTGKTAVFGLTAVEHVLHRHQTAEASSSSGPLVLILAPTREIATQIDAVLRQLTANCSGICVSPFIGGLPVAQDQKRLRAGCHIAVGTPGRVRWLIEDGVLQTKSIRLLVFDEVDKLLGPEFDEDIDAIVASLPERRQTLAFSATFTPEQLVRVVVMMRDPQVVRVRGPSEVAVELVPSQKKQLTEWIEREKRQEPELWLRQVRQYYRVVQSKLQSSSDPLNLKSKLVSLAKLLTEISFSQCIVFCNDKFRAEALATALESQGWPTAAITGAQSQTTRNAVMDRFRAFSLRVLVSTDLTSRGIDVDKVNFVVNLDLPQDPATYLHRVGRTGRFGGKHGLAVTLLSEGEVDGIRLLSRVFRMSVDELPSPAPRDIRTYVGGEGQVNMSGRVGDKDKVLAAEVEVGREVEERRVGFASDGDVEEPSVPSVQTADSVSAPRDNGAGRGSPGLACEPRDGRSPTWTAAASRPFRWEERCYDQWLSLC